MGSEQNRAIVEQMLADLSDWRIDAAMAALAEDASWWIAGTIPGVSGSYTKAQMEGFFRAMSSTLFPNGLDFRLGRIIADEHGVAVQGSSSTRMADGRRYANEYHWAFELEGGRIVAVREYLDTQLVAGVTAA